MASQRLGRDRLVEEAIGISDHDDLGPAHWEEGLDRLLDALEDEGRLSEIGVEVAATTVVGHLVTRAGLLAWRRDHPEVATEEISAPIVIVGQPRTGTTILHGLLACDPGLRAPLTWETARPVPPPEPSTFAGDPRIAEVQAGLELSEAVIPGFMDFHPMGAELPQECVVMTASDFHSMVFSTQFRIPAYERWLIHEADCGPTYRWHRSFLQHLQSRQPAPRWLLKTPEHLWHLPELAAEYPDAVIVQTHRDPLRTISSTSALAAHLRRMASDETSVADAATQYGENILIGLERGMAARDQGTFPADQIVDVRFTDFMADPFAVIRTIYRSMDAELDPDTEQKMRAFLEANPGDGGGGGRRYRFADTGLDAGAVRERCQPYLDRFGVPAEPVI